MVAPGGIRIVHPDFCRALCAILFLRAVPLMIVQSTSYGDQYEMTQSLVHSAV
jgi:hypothetical protein